MRARKGKKAAYFDAWLRLSRLHEQLKHGGYDALGDRSFAHWDSDEILVFNPARVRPQNFFWLHRRGEFPDDRVSLSRPIPDSKLAEISARAQAEVAQEEEAQEEGEEHHGGDDDPFRL